ncbi:MAG: patatin-like phospholipase family protein [Desulfobacteraceae bacterium]|nr:patatin-like phospholipase family protein [Desulfobacteraceae bacterium]
MVTKKIEGSFDAKLPVWQIDIPSKHKEIEDSVALCLSGGGYRAMLFHLGALWRLNELGYLKKLARISSVSGGSITSAVLGMNWSMLKFDDNLFAGNFISQVVRPIRNLASKTIDRKAILSGILTPGSISQKATKAYRKYLFGNKTLQDLPNDPPRFVINSTNVQSGALWRFMKPYMRDWKVGEVKNPTISLAAAVAASSAFPPVLSPAKLKLNNDDFTPNSGVDLQKEPYTTDIILSDGGVYDNLGLETAWKRYKTILVSDGGGRMESDPEPKKDWAGHMFRILQVIDNQVRSLRKKQLIDSFKNGSRNGAYWGIRTNIKGYDLPTAMNFPFDKTMELANVKTRLKKLDSATQERLINWGYAVCDAAIRKHVDSSFSAPRDFPYSESAV